MNKFKLFGILSLLIFPIARATAQIPNSNSDIKPNRILLEIGGFGVIYSVNYERIIKINESYGISAQIGVGTLKFNSINKGNNFDIRIPVHLKVNRIKKIMSYELGLAWMPYNLNENLELSSLDNAMGLETGINWHPKQSNFMIGGSLNLIFYDTGQLELTPWATLKLGYEF